MTDDTLKTCLEVLAAMPSAVPWSDGSGTIYAMAMEGWDDAVALGTVKKVALTLKWRPAAVELRQVAVEQFAPAPSVFTLRQQLREMLLWHGERAGLVEGHVPLLPDIVDRLGGWHACSRMTTEEIDGRFLAVYELAIAEWRDAAADSVLRLGEAERHKALEAGDIRKLGKLIPARVIKEKAGRPLRAIEGGQAA